MLAFNRSTSAIADFMFCPETANCSVRAPIRASDSLSFDKARSYSLCLPSTSVLCVEISNFKRSHVWVISESLVSRPAIRAVISISEEEDLEPPRARSRVTTSPSRVTTVTDGFERRIASASRAESATTILASSDETRALIELERTCDAREVKPAGIIELEVAPSS